jgi:DNA-binding MurR/RpiR family transcriptional regulator
MAYNIVQRIRNIHQRLSKGHKKIANYVINNYEQAAYMTATRLGAQVGVSESTVVRFASELGYEGYAELQKAIQELVQTRLTPNQRIEFTKRRIGRTDILEKVMQTDIDKIRHTINHLDRDAFYKSVDAILSARTIYIIGARSSEPIARMLNYNLSLIFDNVKFVQPNSTAEVFEQLFAIDQGDVLIAFSFPRYSSKVVSAVQYAKQKAANVIVITDSSLSPLAEHATYLLLAESDMASYMDSLVAPMSLVNAIIIEITNRKERAIRDRFDRLEQVWEEYGVFTKRQ